MEGNNFRTNTEPKQQKNFSRKFSILLNLSIWLTGFFTIGSIFIVVNRIRTFQWSVYELLALVWQILVCAACISCCASLAKTAIDQKPFSRPLIFCIDIIGIIFTAASVFFPRMPDYQPSSFRIIASSSFVFIDGTLLLIGIFLLVLAGMIKEGFEMQQEIEEIL